MERLFLGACRARRPKTITIKLTKSYLSNMRNALNLKHVYLVKLTAYIFSALGDGAIMAYYLFIEYNYANTF